MHVRSSTRIGVIVFVTVLLCNYTSYASYFWHPLHFYAQRTLQEKFGHKSLSPELENKIFAVAHEMGFYEPIIIRNMNYQALQLFGYYNIFVSFPTLLGIIPVGGTPHMFVSEGFFEDLSSEEQRFLIGHEMVHVMYRHAEYLFLVWYAVLALLLFCWGFFWVRIAPHTSLFAPRQQAYFFRLMCVVAMFFSIGLLNILVLAYRRHIEWQADMISLETLHSYEGGIKLVNRWQREFRLPHHDVYGGFLADHPSCYERKMYCMHVKNRFSREI